jgi:hypothetical protein
MQKVLWWLGPFYSAAVSIWLLVVPNFATAASTGALAPEGLRIDPSSNQVYTSLLVVEGWWVLVPLSVPVVLSALPLLARSPGTRRRLGLVGCVLLVTFSVVASLSIGMFYLPAAAALLAAALIPPRRVGPLPSEPAV